MQYTCCTLHNLLLERDGLDTNWEQTQLNEHNDTSFAMMRLGNPLLNDNTSNNVIDVPHDTNFSSLCKDYTRNGYRVVRKMPLELFKQCLINHFDIRFKRNDIKWPQRMSTIN